MDPRSGSLTLVRSVYCRIIAMKACARSYICDGQELVKIAYMAECRTI